MALGRRSRPAIHAGQSKHSAGRCPSRGGRSASRAPQQPARRPQRRDLPGVQAPLCFAVRFRAATRLPGSGAALRNNATGQDCVAERKGMAPRPADRGLCPLPGVLLRTKPLQHRLVLLSESRPRHGPQPQILNAVPGTLALGCPDIRDAFIGRECTPTPGSTLRAYGLLRSRRRACPSYAPLRSPAPQAKEGLNSRRFGTYGSGPLVRETHGPIGDGRYRAVASRKRGSRRVGAPIPEPSPALARLWTAEAVRKSVCEGPLNPSSGALPWSVPVVSAGTQKTDPELDSRSVFERAPSRQRRALGLWSGQLNRTREPT